MENISTFISQNLIFCLSFVLLLAIYVIFELIQTKQSKTNLSVQGAVSEVNKHKGVYIDTRSKEEFEKSHIIGAINIATGDIVNSLKKLSKYKSKPIVLYSQANSCDKTAAILRKDGFESIYSLNGGFKAWIAANYPTKNL